MYYERITKHMLKTLPKADAVISIDKNIDLIQLNLLNEKTYFFYMLHISIKLSSRQDNLNFILEKLYQII